MKIKYFIFILLFVLYSLGFAQSKCFFYKIVSNLDNNSYYLCIDVKSKNYTGKIAIENTNLYGFLYKTKKYNFRKYKKEIMKLLLSNKPLEIDDSFFDDFNSTKIIYKKTNEISFQGSKYDFLTEYTENYKIKTQYQNSMGLVLIENLFKYEIPCYRDDESGMIMIVPPDRSDMHNGR